MTDPNSFADKQDADEFETSSVATPAPTKDTMNSSADKSDADEFESSN